MSYDTGITSCCMCLQVVDSVDSKAESPRASTKAPPSSSTAAGGTGKKGDSANGDPMEGEGTKRAPSPVLTTVAAIATTTVTAADASAEGPGSVLSAAAAGDAGVSNRSLDLEPSQAAAAAAPSTAEAVKSDRCPGAFAWGQNREMLNTKWHGSGAQSILLCQCDVTRYCLLKLFDVAELSIRIWETKHLLHWGLLSILLTLFEWLISHQSGHNSLCIGPT